MKVCCNSRSYSRMLSTGELTQLEWVDLCANELNLDGVEFSTSHFPRRDPDYLAQIKKLCVDRCLIIAGVQHDEAFGSDLGEESLIALQTTLDLALALGTPIVRFSLRASTKPPALDWRELVTGLKAASSTAKRLNVTLALEPEAATPVSTPAEAKRIIKECDSAWLRLSSNCRALASAGQELWAQTLDDSVIAVAPLGSLDTFGAEESIDYIGALSVLWQRHYRGFLTLEYTGEEAERPAVGRAVAWLRGMLAKDELRAAVT
jgi:sugar phosphate isomerase/epimerase